LATFKLFGIFAVTMVKGKGQDLGSLSLRKTGSSNASFLALPADLSIWLPQTTIVFSFWLHRAFICHLTPVHGR
jgi:hypothetical protein